MVLVVIEFFDDYHPQVSRVGVTEPPHHQWQALEIIKRFVNERIAKNKEDYLKSLQVLSDVFKNSDNYEVEFELFKDYDKRQKFNGITDEMIMDKIESDNYFTIYTISLVYIEPKENREEKLKTRQKELYTYQVFEGC